MGCDRGHQPLRRKGLRDRGEPLEQALEFHEFRVCPGVGRQERDQRPGLGERGLAVQHRVHQ